MERLPLVTRNPTMTAALPDTLGSGPDPLPATIASGPRRRGALPSPETVPALP